MFSELHDNEGFQFLNIGLPGKNSSGGVMFNQFNDSWRVYLGKYFNFLFIVLYSFQGIEVDFDDVEGSFAHAKEGLSLSTVPREASDAVILSVKLLGHLN